MPALSDIAAAFARPDRPKIEARLLLMVAHPDDETIALGSQLCRCQDLILLHLTDGAPHNLVDARRYGFEDAASYAAARSTELDAALAAGAVKARRLGLNWADQSLSGSLFELARWVMGVLEELRPHVLITHAYEGGHPDHDAAAFAGQLAASGLASAVRPERLEFAGYNGARGLVQWGRFIPKRNHPAAEIMLTKQERARKKAMLACFQTQAGVLADAPLNRERLRTAPQYDFTAPPHAGALWYEGKGWGATGESWRAGAKDALDRMGA